MRRWLEEAAAQRLLLTTPSVLLGERLSVYRVEGTTQWYSAFIIAHNTASGEFTVTDDTVLEEHLESPELVQMRILGHAEGGGGRRSRASAYRLPARVERKRRSVSATNTGRNCRPVLRLHSDATPALLCQKDTAQGTKSPLSGHFLPFAVSLWHKGVYNRFFRCMEAT